MKLQIFRAPDGIQLLVDNDYEWKPLTDIQVEDLSRALNRVASGREETAEVDLS